MSEEGCRIRILVETEAQRAEALAAIEALAPEVRWLSGAKPTELHYEAPHAIVVGGVNLYRNPCPSPAAVPWSTLHVASLLAALRPQPAEPVPPPGPESWPGPDVQEEGGSTYGTEIYRDGRLRVGCFLKLTADSVRNLIVAYNRHHGLAFASGEPTARPAAASSEPAAGVAQVGRHWLRLRPDRNGDPAVARAPSVEVALCDEAGTILDDGFAVGFYADADGKLYCKRYSGVNPDHCLTDDECRIQDVSD
jgi:hypothetical protein